MLSLLETFITSRLEMIKFNYATALPAGPTGVNYRPVKVYPYLPDREKKETIYPSYAFERVEVNVREASKSSEHEVFIPSAKTITVQLPYAMDRMRSYVTGVESYTRKPYPTPLDITYEINTLGSNKAHADFLIEMLYQAFPPGFQSKITGLSEKHYALFSLSHPINLDDLDRPEFRTGYVFTVSDLWLDRVEHWEHPSIASFLFDVIDIAEEE